MKGGPQGTSTSSTTVSRLPWVRSCGALWAGWESALALFAYVPASQGVGIWCGHAVTDSKVEREVYFK